MDRGKRAHLGSAGSIGPVEPVVPTRPRRPLPEGGNREGREALAGPEEPGRDRYGRESTDGAEELWEPGGWRFGEWWAGLPPARRAMATAAAAAVLLAGGAGYHIANRPPEPEPEPVPWPTMVTSVRYQGLVEPAEGENTFTVHMTVTVAKDAQVPVTVTRVYQEYSGLSSRTEPPTPLTVKPGESRPIAMAVSVRDCASTPVFAGMPLINVTLRNTRAIGTRSEIFGERYADALSAALHRLCPTAPKPST